MGAQIQNTDTGRRVAMAHVGTDLLSDALENTVWHFELTPGSKSYFLLRKDNPHCLTVGAVAANITTYARIAAHGWVSPSLDHDVVCTASPRYSSCASKAICWGASDARIDFVLLNHNTATMKLTCPLSARGESIDRAEFIMQWRPEADFEDAKPWLATFRYNDNSATRAVVACSDLLGAAKRAAKNKARYMCLEFGGSNASVNVGGVMSEREATTTPAETINATVTGSWTVRRVVLAKDMYEAACVLGDLADGSQVCVAANADDASPNAPLYISPEPQGYAWRVTWGLAPWNPTSWLQPEPKVPLWATLD